ncbi:MAG: hypothetical protein M3394_01475, partial [Actinomycetota bacterium]|nr:hypothetical protein [Actinomycetota bacterium]
NNIFTDTFDSLLPRVERGKGLVGWLGEKFNFLKEKTEDATGATERQADAASRVVGELEREREATEAQTKALEGLLVATTAQFSSELAYERSLDSLQDAQAKVAEATRAHTEAIRQHGPKSTEGKAAAEELSRAQLGERDAALSVAAAAVRQAEDQAKANGETLTAAQRHDLFRSKLLEVRDSLAAGSPLRAALDQYIHRLSDVPTIVKAQVQLETEAAYRDFRQMERDFANATTKATAPAPSNTGGAKRMASGGVVPARAGGTPVIAAEAGKPEAFVPLPDGRRIPVSLTGGAEAGPGVVVMYSPHITVKAETNASAADIGHRVEEVLRRDTGLVVAALSRYVGSNAIPTNIRAAFSR